MMHSSAAGKLDLRNAQQPERAHIRSGVLLKLCFILLREVVGYSAAAHFAPSGSSSAACSNMTTQSPGLERASTDRTRFARAAEYLIALFGLDGGHTSGYYAEEWKRADAHSNSA